MEGAFEARATGGAAAATVGVVVMGVGAEAKAEAGERKLELVSVQLWLAVADAGKEGVAKAPAALEGVGGSRNCHFCWTGEEENETAGDRKGSSAENGNGGRGEGVTEGGLGVTSTLIGFVGD